MKSRDLVSPRPPASLSKAAKDEWRSLAPLAWNTGSLRAETFRAFALLCESLAQERAANDIVQREGLTVGEARKMNPALKIGAEARRVAMKLLEQFRLSPGARADVPPTGGEEALETLNESAIEHCFGDEA